MSTETPSWPAPTPPTPAEREALSTRLRAMARELCGQPVTSGCCPHDGVTCEGWGGLA